MFQMRCLRETSGLTKLYSLPLFLVRVGASTAWLNPIDSQPLVHREGAPLYNTSKLLRIPAHV